MKYIKVPSTLIEEIKFFYMGGISRPIILQIKICKERNGNPDEVPVTLFSQYS